MYISISSYNWNFIFSNNFSGLHNKRLGNLITTLFLFYMHKYFEINLDTPIQVNIFLHLLCNEISRLCLHSQRISAVVHVSNRKKNFNIVRLLDIEIIQKKNIGSRILQFFLCKTWNFKFWKVSLSSLICMYYVFHNMLINGNIGN